MTPPAALSDCGHQDAQLLTPPSHPSPHHLTPHTNREGGGEGQRGGERERQGIKEMERERGGGGGGQTDRQTDRQTECGPSVRLIKKVSC